MFYRRDAEILLGSRLHLNLFDQPFKHQDGFTCRHFIPRVDPHLQADKIWGVVRHCSL